MRAIITIAILCTIFPPGWASRSGLRLSQTTQMGGFLAKKFKTKGQDCVGIPSFWQRTYPRTSIGLDGKCIAIHAENNCSGDPSKILHSQGPRRYSELVEKIPVASIRACTPAEVEQERLSSPKLYIKRLKLTNDSVREKRAISSRRQQGVNRNWDNPDVVLNAGLQPWGVVKFYSQPDFRGASFKGTITGGCITLPSRQHQRILSISSKVDCICLYEQRNCKGRSIQVQSKDEYARNLAELDFDRQIKSYGPCQEYQKLGLIMHNYYRGLHGSPPLKMKESLNLSAKLMAEYLATQPALPKPIGFISAELFYATNDGPVDDRFLVRDAIQSWYREGEKYDGNNPVASRFTQLIWKNNKDFGIGTARAGGRAVVVANYFPRANIAGQYAENVRPRIY